MPVNLELMKRPLPGIPGPIAMDFGPERSYNAGMRCAAPLRQPLLAFTLPRTSAWFALVLLFCRTPAALQAAEPASIPKERVGVYDSRAIAVAYVGSAAHNKRMDAMQTELARANAAGDTKRARELQSQGASLQRTLHEQGFSTAPVDDLLKLVEERLPAIRKEAGVTELISKWDEGTLGKHAGAERVDVTMALVKAFDPNERQMKTAVEIQKHQPIPRDKAKRIKD